MKQYYECHLTIEEGDPLKAASGLYHNGDIRHAVEKIGWIYSAIDGDANLGPGRKHYATKQFNLNDRGQGVQGELDTARVTLVSQHCNVVRAKIELVIYDGRAGRDF